MDEKRAKECGDGLWRVGGNESRGLPSNTGNRIEVLRLLHNLPRIVLAMMTHRIASKPKRMINRPLHNLPDYPCHQYSADSVEFVLLRVSDIAFVCKKQPPKV